MNYFYDSLLNQYLEKIGKDIGWFGDRLEENDHLAHFISIADARYQDMIDEIQKLQKIKKPLDDLETFTIPA